jgi:hypothetical protein
LIHARVYGSAAARTWKIGKWHYVAGRA